MSTKWTKARREKYQATIARKRRRNGGHRHNSGLEKLIRKRDELLRRVAVYNQAIRLLRVVK